MEKYKIWHPEKSVILTENIGEGAKIHAPVWIGKDVKIGCRVKIQAFAFIPEGVTIEDDVFIAPGVVFTNDKYPPSGKWSEILVKKGASIGANATIVTGVQIGEKSMVGAGSVVTKNIPANEIWLGSPAKFYKKRQ